MSSFFLSFPSYICIISTLISLSYEFARKPPHLTDYIAFCTIIRLEWRKLFFLNV